MAKQIARLLKATIEDTSDLKQIAKKLAAKGRGNDTMLAHITPREAKILKAAGGSGTINPDTGLVEFEDSQAFEMPAYTEDAYSRQAGMFDFPAGYTQTQVAGPEYDAAAAPPAAAPAAVPDVTAAVPATAPAAPAEMPVTYNWTGAPAAGGVAPAVTEAPTAAVPVTQPVPGAGVPQPAFDVEGFYGIDERQIPGATGEKSLAQKAREYLTSADKVGVTPLERLGIAGLSSIPGIVQARRAQAQGQQAKQETQALAAPYRARADELLTQAKTGQLSAPEQQQIQAMQARLQQDIATRGGAGAQQAMNQLESFRQQLLANKYDLGLKISNISDQIAIGAIRAGLQADQYVDQLTSTYFNNALRMAMSMGQPQVPTVVYAPRA